ncbi:kinase-like domain-containing protein [Trametes gibbosa]|nr:kinase-like domain-containing protein [Trametes gibbosa]
MEPPAIARPAGGSATPASQDGPIQSTQRPTQATQQATPQPEYGIDPNAWGVLVPYNSPGTETITFQRWKCVYQIGRSASKAQGNDVVLPGLMISAVHCQIEWDGVTGPNPSVTVSDKSSNGTYINGQLIGNSRAALLREGNELAFGTWVTQDTEDGQRRGFRYIYRHAAYSRPAHGLYQQYDLHDQLGKGSFATVVKALRRDDGKWYALKVIDLKRLRKEYDHVMSGTVEVETISKEIGILQRLQHPNICELKDFFLDGSSLSLVLEWVPRGDLLKYLHDNYKTCLMSEQTSQYITYQICKALSYVHSQGIAHRDLKPENVLLTDDDPPVVKVADFGLAKAIDSESLLKTMCGTPIYSAPEVSIQGDQGYSLLVDSWSVGVIVFSMLTMTMPFPEETTRSLELIASRVPQWSTLYQREGGISAEGEDFIRSLLVYDPKERMSMADACVHRWLSGEAERELNITNRAPISHDPAASHGATLRPTSAATSSTASDHTVLDRPIGPTDPDPSSHATMFARLESFASVPGLQLTRQPEVPPPPPPQTPGARAPDEDAPSERARTPTTTTTKRTASLAFTSTSSSSSSSSGGVALADRAGATPRSAGAAARGARGRSGRAPGSKRARVEARASGAGERA